VRGLVSGGTAGNANVLLAYTRQGQITATHQTLGTVQKVANLRTQLTVGCPAFAHGFYPEQCASNVAVVSARLRCIERLQGVQVQQGSTRDFLCGHRRPLALNGIGLHLVPRQSRAQMGIEGHSQAIGRAVLQFRGERGPQTVRSIFRPDVQLRACMRQALATGNLPEVEGQTSG